jgi:hypothetical protein
MYLKEKTGKLGVFHRDNNNKLYIYPKKSCRYNVLDCEHCTEYKLHYSGFKKIPFCNFNGDLLESKR